VKMRAKYLGTAIVFLWVSALCRAQQVPVTHARALDKSAVTLPQSKQGKPLILLISFSHKGEKECDRWNQRLKPAYMHESKVDYYELADFEGVPSFVMSFILHGMRREIPRDEHSHFVPFYSGEAEWKKLVAYSSPEDAYLVVADAAGHVLWQGHGPLSDSKYSELQAVVTKQVSKP